jgi:hypothetical protein
VVASHISEKKEMSGILAFEVKEAGKRRWWATVIVFTVSKSSTDIVRGSVEEHEMGRP